MPDWAIFLAANVTGLIVGGLIAMRVMWRELAKAISLGVQWEIYARELEKRVLLGGLLDLFGKPEKPAESPDTLVE